LDTVFSNDADTKQSIFKLYSKIVYNIKESPNEAKFRKINLEKLMAKMPHGKGMKELLLAVGFTDSEASIMVLSPSSPVAPLISAWNQIVDREMKEDQLKQTKLAELARIQAENQAEINAIKTKKSTAKQNIKGEIEASKKFNAEKPVTQGSVANKMNFGMKMGKLPEPPPQQQGKPS
jgi:hypothetical protein